MAAVQQNGHAMEYASAALQNNKPLVRQLLANLTKATHAKTQEIQSLKAKNHNLTSLLSVRVHNLETNEDEIMFPREDTLRRDSKKRKRDSPNKGSSVEAQMHQLDKKIKVKMEEAEEDLEDANELTEQTALMLNSWQSKFDDLAELAKNHGAGVAEIGAIRSRQGDRHGRSATGWRCTATRVCSSEERQGGRHGRSATGWAGTETRA